MKFEGFCQRCGVKTDMHTTSMFNTQSICIDCSRKEEAHRDFEKAREADRAEVRKGNWNFEGIGLPHDL